MPSATPSEADLAAWAELSRDEQVRRYQEALSHPDCSTPADETVSDILAACRGRATFRADG